MATGEREIQLPGGALIYQADFVPAPDQLFQQLRDHVMWQQPMLQVFGRWSPTPRLVSFVGDDGLSYRYSGQQHDSMPWPDALLPLKAALVDKYGLLFNCALLNYYRDGKDCMGWHSDNERELWPSPAIASISVGECRDFRLRPSPKGCAAGHPPVSIALEHGSLLLMLPPTQSHWQHSLPKRAKRGPRINITFRQLIR